jgi:hypothetical protein
MTTDNCGPSWRGIRTREGTIHKVDFGPSLFVMGHAFSGLGRSHIIHGLLGSARGLYSSV